MKKGLYACLVLLLAMSLTACGSKEIKTGESESSLLVESEESNRETEADHSKESQSETEEGMEPDETEEVETLISSDAEANIAALVARAKEEGAICAAAYIGYLDRSAYEAANSMMKSTSHEDGYDAMYGFLNELPQSNEFLYDGDEVYCIVPFDKNTEITFREYEAFDEEGNSDIVGDIIFNSDNGLPVIFSCNVSDIMGNIQVTLKDESGREVSYVPGLSLKDGSLMVAEGVFDFSLTNTPDEEVTLVIDDYYEYSGDYEDAADNYITYSYRLPMVSGISSPYIDQMNADMKKIREEQVKPQVKMIKKKETVVNRIVNYDYDYYNGIYSLKVYIYNDNDYAAYYIYNFDASGKQVSHEEILRAAGAGSDAYLSAAKKKMEAVTKVSDKLDADTKKELLKLQEKTLSSENCNLDMPLYLNSFGTLSFIGRVYSMAGAEYYDHTFVLAPKRGFDEEEIALLSLDYYERMYTYRPGEAAALVDGEKATVQLYDSFDGHNSTSDWYELSTKTGKGKNVTGDKIDVTFY